jgi:hypothetical protein
MAVPLIVSVGMPRAGSGWYYNLMHDLNVAGGGKDARFIRKNYHLGPILTEVNCNIGAFTAKRLIPVLVPALLGNSYVIKAHAGPSCLTIKLIEKGMLRAGYIFRDPRDALLSAYEYGQRKRDKGRKGAFSDLLTIEDAILFMDDYVKIAEMWLSYKGILHTRYEDLLQNYWQEAERLALYLHLNPEKDEVKAIIEGHHPRKGSPDTVGTHFVQGKIGRYRDFIAEKEKQMCIDRFGTFLEKMGYPIP